MTDMLKLRAKDAEDLQVISAVLQDAIVPVCDLAFEPDNQRFVMATQRLRRADDDKQPCERICCAVNLRGVTGAETHGIDLKNREQILELLAIMLEKDRLTFVFAGDARIRLALGDWVLLIEDFGEAWPALCNPCHDSAA
ncbi:MAG: DUF2948 family protein [Alphaproteobacteria bacterium]|nr:DUF2948 family protein [Alphaproteobacteria bacterium]